MAKREITKNKTAFSIDKDVMKVIIKLAKKMNLKKSYIVNKCLRQVLFDEYFETADKIEIKKGGTKK